LRILFLVAVLSSAAEKLEPAALLAAGRYEEARAALAGAKSPQDLANRCTANYKLKNWDSAIEDCSAALRLQPKYKKTLAPQLSDSHYRRGLQKGGAEDFYAAVRADRENPLPYVELGRRALAQKQAATALKYLDRAILADPSLARAFSLRSEANAALGRRRQAESDAARAAKLLAAPLP
jgi:tetratricopeptide (TPR) repeat protein